VLRVSDTGIDSHTPFKPQKPGKSSNDGIRKSNCLVVERITAMPALPIDWKKLDVTI
jgi:hypothetical protein